MKLLEPIKIKNLTLKNRIVMPAMDTNLGSKKHIPSKKTLQYYEVRAKGGVGLIIVEPAYFDKRGSTTPEMLSIEDDDKIEPLKELTQIIKKYDVGVFLQIYHAGNQASAFLSGLQPVSVSNVPCGLTNEEPIPLTIEDIKKMIIQFADACQRAKKAGFDGVEIHAGHGYLMTQFLSKIYNKRTDEYGGSLENRMRFLIEVAEAIRNKCGEDFIICYRLNGSDFQEGGSEIEDIIEVSKALEKAGVDLIHVTGGVLDSPRYPTVGYMNYPRGYFADYAAKIKNVLKKTKVIVVGRINDPDIAEEILSKGKADLVAIGRGLIGDPCFPLKIMEERIDKIRKCIGCNACINQILINKKVKCAMNANLLAAEDDVGKTNEPKKVLIVGAGPGGLEAARVAKLRGHEVLVIEKDGKIGGSLYLAAAAPMKGEVNNAIQYFNNVLNELEVEIRLNTDFSEKIIDEYNPDIVIMATGSIPVIPPIKGIQNTNYYLYSDVLAGKIPEGENIAIIGGGMVGLETAELLSHLNKKVTIVEMLRKIGNNITALVAKEILPLYEQDKNLTIHLKTRIDEIKENKLIGMKNEEPITIEFDDLVVATGSKPNVEIEGKIIDKCEEIYKIGDCKKVRRIFEAVKEGYEVAMNI